MINKRRKVEKVGKDTVSNLGMTRPHGLGTILNVKSIRVTTSQKEQKE